MPAGRLTLFNLNTNVFELFTITQLDSAALQGFAGKV